MKMPENHKQEGLEVMYLSGIITSQKLSLEEKLAELQSYPTNTEGGREVKEELCRNVELALQSQRGKIASSVVKWGKI